MPYLDPVARDIYFRCWDVPDPIAVAVFAHGFGEHLDLYGGLAAALGGQGIELWGVELPGHGRSAGRRGIVPLDAGVEAIDRQAAPAHAARDRVRLVAMGHSLGAVVVSAAVVRGRVPADAMLLSAPPLDGVTMADLGSLTQPSADPFYLDQLANDPYAFPMRDAFEPLIQTITTAMPELHAGLPRLGIPVGLVSGNLDPFCTPAVSARWSGLIPTASALVVDGDHHDVLNDIRHRDTEAAVAGFILSGRLSESPQPRAAPLRRRGRGTSASASLPHRSPRGSAGRPSGS
ncbi:MAG TPA: alpha/beta fold hydrolase [Candidatus Sulfotelmatobacter sp.]|nr:alpha/beta fold hydrolase [Candidatus Sulfotelmatobacter sp.]